MERYTKREMNRRGKNLQKLRKLLLIFLIFLAVPLLLAGCGKDSAGDDPYVGVAQVLQPVWTGEQVEEQDGAQVDLSNISKGYVIVRYEGDAPWLSVQLTGSDSITYKYKIEAGDGDTVIPLTEGDGNYTLEIYENIVDEQYAYLMSADFQVEMESMYLPFLYPNQYVDFTADSEAVKKAEELAESAESDLEVLQNIFEFVITNVTYDFDKAASVPSGYLPDVDETLETGTGICFDYAALMTAMLRSRGIPTQLEIGYTNDGVYHAWISTYLQDKGWVDNIIEFDGKSWELMDPTMVAAVETRDERKQVVEDSSDYIVKYRR